MIGQILDAKLSRLLLVLAITVCPSTLFAYTLPPTAPTWSTNGNYTVSFQYQCSNNCMSQWLEESGPSGSFATYGSSPQSFTGKPNGEYTYRVARFMGSPYYVMEYSSEVTVHVTPNAPSVDPLLTQRDYQFQVRVGDINYDGKKDLFIKRTSGGVADNGIIEEVILQQITTADEFLAIAPSSSQSSTASSWPVSSAQIAVEDINVDGFVDVVAKGVAGAVNVSGMHNQIVYSPGEVFNPQPKGLRTVDDDILEFAGSMLDYQVNQDYFSDYAPIIYYYSTYVYSSCNYGMYNPDPLFQSYYGGCYWSYSSVFGYYPDYSVFSGAAVAIWATAENVKSGQISTSDGVNDIVEATEVIIDADLGGWGMEEVLGSTGEHTDPDTRKALEVLMAVLSIGRANAQDVETDEAEPQAPRSGSAIYLVGRQIQRLGIDVGGHSAIEHNANPSIPCVSNQISTCNTISAFPEDGDLVYVPNATLDSPLFNMTLGTIQRLPTSSSALWSEMVAQAEAYDNSASYAALLCEAIPGKYNSNSFVAGIIDHVNAFSTYDLSRLWCGDKPVPISYFQ